MVLLSLGVVLLASTGPRFVIEPPECPPDWFAPASLERMLRADTSTKTRAFIAVIVTDCALPDRVTFTIIHNRAPAESAFLDLAAVPKLSRLRTLAIAIADRLAPALEGPPRHPEKPVWPQKPKSIEKPGSTKTPGARWSLGAQTELQAGLRRGEVLGGGRIAAALAVDEASTWILRGGVSGALGQTRVEAGRVRLSMVNFQLGVHVQLNISRWRLSAGPEFWAGWARVAADAGPSDGMPAGRSAATFALGGVAQVSLRTFGSVWVQVALGLRTHIRGLEGLEAGAVVTGLSGLFLSAGAGVFVAL